MFRFGKRALPFALLGLVAVWAGFTFAPSASVVAADPKAVDLTALREAVDAAAKRGENVDDIRKALVAFEKALPSIKPGTVPPELQALRDAVDAAARKGENVDDVAKQLLAVEMAVAGKSLAKPKPIPPQPPVRPMPPNPFDVPFPIVPFPNPNPGAGIDVELLKKSLDLRKRAQELLLKDPNDPEAKKEAEKLIAEATDLLMKAGGGVAFPPLMPDFPGRIPERARLGIRMEKVTPVVAEQLGLEKNQGIVVSSVLEGSAAEKAGLKTHDIILEFAGKQVSDNTDDFARMVNEVKTGVKVDIVVLRKGKKVEIKGIELPDMAKVRPQPFPFPMLPNPALPPNILPLPGVQPIKPLPVPPAIDLPVFPNPLPNPPGGFDTVNVNQGNGQFTITATQGEVKFRLTGTTENGKVALTKAVITEGEKTIEAETLEKVPADYRPAIEKLLKGVRKG
ncbi:MAG: PDZ domain-containing protein [Planctomycetia bacterium]|nr:PDZ domain-containing protein [Planctomycetia bacterium]